MIRYDEAWKEALEHFLRPILTLLFPRAEARIDWSKGHDSLEQELRSMLPDAETGNRLADKVVRVQTFEEDERILAVEVQAQPRPGFPRRVYVYHYRADDRFSGPPESLVILADDDPAWRPTSYEVRHEYSSLTFTFEPAKLLDWRGREEELRRHDNPMAMFVLAHLEAQRTRNDDQERADVKLGLLLRLAARTLEEDDRRHWHRFLGWLLPLPDQYEEQVFSQAAERTRNKEQEMEFVSYMERKGIAKGEIKGKVDGLLTGIEAVLDLRFGAAGLALMPEVRSIDSPDRLGGLLAAAKSMPTLDEVRQALADSRPAESNGSQS